MKILIAAIGKAKASPELALYQHYIKRLPWKVELREIDVKIADAGKRQAQEGEKLLSAVGDASRVVALDEAGRSLTSREIAAQLERWRQGGDSSVAFVIGGSDGLAAPVRERADLVLSLGKPTWPHLLVRAMLAEQLYRAWSLISGHPYHRD